MILERVVEEYKTGNYSFPSDSLKKSLKNNPEFFLRISQAIMRDYTNDRCCVPYTKTRRISELRSYAKGEQDTNKYKPLLCSAMKENGGKAYMNISWAAVRSIPKFRNVVKGIALKTAFDLNVDALDPSSISDRKVEEAFWKLNTDPEWVAFSKEMKSMGVQVPKQKFESEQQVDVWMKSGGLKLAVEIAMKTALEATLYLSKFDDSIKVQLIDDLIDIGMIGTRDYVESGTRYVKARYVDPEYYVGRYSQFLDNNNSDYGAELRFMTIGEIRRESDLSDAQLAEVAKFYQKDYSNHHLGTGEGIFNTVATRS